MNAGDRIKELRQKAGFTQNRLAEWAGISQTHLRRVELGMADITVSHLRLICDALGITLRDFFNFSEDKDDLSVAISSLTPKQRRSLLEFLNSLS